MVKPNYYTFSFKELNITKEAIEFTMGFVPGQTPPPFNEIIDKVLGTAEDYCNIKGAAQIIPQASADMENHSLVMDWHTFHTGKRITALLADIEALIAIIVTAGKGMEKWMQQCNDRGDTFTSYVVDVTGSEIVDKTALKLREETVKAWQLSGLGISNIFSPGYCEWPVSDQETLFSFFPEGCCGIYLNDTQLMDPIKSISGIMGIGTRVSAHGEDYCSHCENTHCIYRHRRHQH